MPCGPVLTFDETLDDPHVMARDMVAEVEHPIIGEMRTIGPPTKFSGIDFKRPRPRAVARPAHRRDAARDRRASDDEIDSPVHRRASLFDAHPELDERTDRHDRPPVVERRDSIATLVLNRPESHNAINVRMYTRPARHLVRDLDDDPAVKVIVLRGAGEQSFASGADISEFEQERGDAVRPPAATTRRSPAAEHAIEGMTKPTIAMVHGYCIGGGAGLALACDMRFADTRSSLRDHAGQARPRLQPRVDASGWSTWSAPPAPSGC